jgi:hypothetical protein
MFKFSTISYITIIIYYLLLLYYWYYIIGIICIIGTQVFSSFFLYAHTIWCVDSM